MAREARGGPSLASRPTSFVLDVMFDVVFDVMWCACVFSFHVVVSSRWWCWVYIDFWKYSIYDVFLIRSSTWIVDAVTLSYIELRVVYLLCCICSLDFTRDVH